MAEAAVAQKPKVIDDLKPAGSVRVDRGRSRQTAEDDGLSDDDALKIARETIKRKDATIATLGKQATEAEGRVASTVLGRIADREVAIDNAVGAAKLSCDTAEQAWRAARGNNDVDAEAEAMKNWQKAGSELERWTAEQTKFRAEKPNLEKQAKDRVAAASTNHPEWDEAAAQWLADHPRFNKDDDYKAKALKLDAAAKALGKPGGSPENLAYIDEGLADIYGKDHGKVKQQQHRRTGNDADEYDDDQPARRTTRRSTVSDGAPPGRELDSGSYSAHGVTLTRNADGTKRVTGTAPADWVEGAKMCRMSLADYCISQLEIEEEAKNGTNTPLRLGDGMIYRG